jgi:uncharacterized protein Veg
MRCFILSSIIEIRKNLKQHLGDSIEIVESGSRNRVDIYTGRLREVYHSVFVIETEKECSKCKRVTYNYADVLTNVIDVKFL